MKRFYVSLGILAVIAGLSVFSTVRVLGARDTFGEIFSDTDAPLADTLGRAEESWNQKAEFLHFLMDRDLLDEVDSALAEARALLDSGRAGEASGRCAWLRTYLDGILNSELPTPDNLF